ncbi:MAG: TolB family protein, partial [Planctomycetota bacterium]
MCLRHLIGFVFLSISAAVCVAAPADQTRPFSVHDILAMERISDPQVSPDGERIVFVLRKTDLQENLGRTDLWLVGVDGTGLRRLTSHPEKDSNPRWAPDGKSIWFLSKRSESSQVWRIKIDGGEAEQVTDLPLDVGNLVVSRDGPHIAFTMEVFVDCDSIECTKDRLEEIENKKASGRIYNRIFVRHWDTWKDGRRSHLFLMPAKGGEPVDVMQGMDADTPSKPFGGPGEITFTPNGRGII